MQQGYVAYTTMRNGVIIDEGSRNPITTPRNYSFLKRIISAADVVSDAFLF